MFKNDNVCCSAVEFLYSHYGAHKANNEILSIFSFITLVIASLILYSKLINQTKSF